MGLRHVLSTKNSVQINNYSIYRREKVRELMRDWRGDVSQKEINVEADR